jgi:peptidoglycan lytic transglycosylase
MTAWRLIGLGLAAVLAACSSQTVPPVQPQVSDGAPLKTIRPEDVADAQPRPDPILAQGNKSPYTVNGVSYQILDDYRGYSEEGLASWYGTKFDGRKTSNGEIFDLYGASAAHKTLPIPSYARVTNLSNGRSMVVRVNDRGPFHADRVIDLSYGAAVKLGYMEHGTARVRVDLIDVEGTDDRRDAVQGSYRYLQLGAFGMESSALRLKGELEALVTSPVFISQVQSGGNLLYRVRVGPVADQSELLALQEQLRASGYNAGQPLP